MQNSRLIWPINECFWVKGEDLTPGQANRPQRRTTTACFIALTCSSFDEAIGDYNEKIMLVSRTKVCDFWVLLYWIWRPVLYNTTRQVVWQNAAASCQCVPMHKCGRAGSKQHWILCNRYTDWRTLSNFINNDVTVPSVNVAHSCAYQTYFCKHKVTNVQKFLASTHLH